MASSIFILSLILKKVLSRTLAVGSGLWPVMVLFSEVVQTFILADFCYYYMISSLEGGSVVRLPAGLV